MHRLTAVLLLAVGCADEEPPTLELVGIEPTAPGLSGVDSDGDGGLWLAFRAPTTDYYAKLQVRFEHVSSTGALLHSFTLNDAYEPVVGLALADGALWVNYNAGGTSDDRVRKLDPVTGAELASFATRAGIADLAWRDGELLLSYLWNQVIAIDPARGGELWRAAITGFPDTGVQRGLAVDADGMWILDQETDHVHVVADDGAVLRSYRIPGEQNTYGDTDQLTWDGDRLLVAHDDQLVRFRVPR